MIYQWIDSEHTMLRGTETTGHVIIYDVYHPDWASVSSQKDILEFVAPEIVIDPKLVGVEFEGIMCSATSSDQNGVVAVLMAIQIQGASFKPTRFEFENGSTLNLTYDNYQAFTEVWMPFRQSFFTT